MDDELEIAGEKAVPTCETCRFYSFKVLYADGYTEGKCFGWRAEEGIRWTKADESCERHEREAEGRPA